MVRPSREEPARYVVGPWDHATRILLGPFVVLDTALNEAIKRSKKDGPSATALSVVCVEDYGKRTVRAFAWNGYLQWASVCKACKGTGECERSVMYPNVAINCADCAGIGAVQEHPF